MYNINDELSTITTIPKVTLEKLEHTREDIIGHAIYENINEGNRTPKIDIGLGTLIINIASDEIEYKFVPSNTLESTIVSTVKKNKSPLVKKVESAVVKRIMSAYKDLF